MEDSVLAGIEVFVGVDIAKGDHYACAVTSAGTEVLARGVPNDEASISRLIDDAAAHGTVALVIDTTSSAASLLLEAATRREVPVAYVTGLAMRRAADLYAGAAKTDPKDAFVLADYARRNADRLPWTQPSDELLARLRILNGRDADLAADATPPGPPTASETLCWPWRPPWSEPSATRWPPARAHATPWRAGAPPRAQICRQGPAAGPHRQTLAPHRGAPHRRDLGRARRSESHRHRRGRLGRHHHRARRGPRPDL